MRIQKNQESVFKVSVLLIICCLLKMKINRGRKRGGKIEREREGVR